MKVLREKILCSETILELEKSVEAHEEKGWWKDGQGFQKVVNNANHWCQKLHRVVEDMSSE